jgi:flavin-dependent dehydrogenase
MLVGDSAGFADPITGEGIFFALREAQIASKAILEGLTLGHECVEKYNDLLKKEFMDELTYAKRLRYMLYRLPFVSHTVLKSRGSILGQYYLHIASGRMSYSELYRRCIPWAAFFR